MVPAELHAFPTLAAGASATTYFWHQLPYAVPGFISFIVGALLTALSAYATLRRRERRLDTVALALSALGYGSLGLVLGLRAVVLDHALLLILHTVFYPLALLLTPGSCLLVYALTGRRHRDLLVFATAAGLTVLLGWYALATGTAFSTTDGHTFGFGYYPTAGRLIAPWAIVGVAIGVPRFTPLLVRELFRSGRGQRLHLIGTLLLVLLTSLNLPVFLGLPVFPPGLFSFVPMVMVAYGVFRADFLDLNDLLFAKRGLYYVICVLLALTFGVLATLVAFGLDPSALARLPWIGWPLIPLVSALTVFALGIFVSGADPTAPLNLLAGASFFVLGFLTLSGVVRTLPIDPLVALRIDQLCYLVFGLAPSVLPRFALASVGLRVPRGFVVLDVIGVLSSAVALTQLMFKGYWVYEFARVPASGPAAKLFAVAGVVGTALGMRALRELRRQPRASLVAIAQLLSGLLILSNIAATNGLAVYTFGNLQALPALLASAAVLGGGPMRLREESVRVSSGMTLLAATMLPLLGVVLWALSPAWLAPRLRMLHAALLLSPIALMLFLLLFVFSQPIARRLEERAQRIEEEMRRAEVLLRNVLPDDVVNELKTRGRVKPRLLPEVTVLFTDIVGFTALAAALPPEAIVRELDAHFSRFDAIAARYGLERLKTIGDSYMAAAGLTRARRTDAVDACLAALEMLRAVEEAARSAPPGAPRLAVRIGLHTGPVVAGVIGKAKFAFDIWGDTVNIAARIEAASEEGRINVSERIYQRTLTLFAFTARGDVPVRNRGSVAMYFLDGVRPEFAGHEGASEAFAAARAEVLSRPTEPPPSSGPVLDSTLQSIPTAPAVPSIDTVWRPTEPKGPRRTRS